MVSVVPFSRADLSAESLSAHLAAESATRAALSLSLAGRRSALGEAQGSQGGDDGNGKLPLLGMNGGRWMSNKIRNSGSERLEKMTDTQEGLPAADIPLYIAHVVTLTLVGIHLRATLLHSSR